MIRDNIYRWIKSILDQRFIHIKYDNSISEYRQIRQGLPQGSVLSPLLFNLMINDFVDALCGHEPEVQSLDFTDDLVIWTMGRDLSACKKHSNRFFKRWSVENEMTVNPGKTNSSTLLT
ncbi:putative rna-directed dna polymerase from transposon bs [Caerostris darwini]|uniref:Rna-directed dna polymerase from transposon bs n=1 Tax=Caerostris darwini TaxID=1538125 RepID=A0AAV4SWS7_9ARAC|nr:putative rna-directed dna polymerase from transposon bs [Caerostris darwini]